MTWGRGRAYNRGTGPGRAEAAVMGAYGVLLIAALILVSGVIAYIGDILGRWMGKRRMTVFHLRPRHTAIITSIIAGMLIAVLTLGSAMAVSENVRDGLTKVGIMRRQNHSLREQQKAISQQLEDTRKGLQGANQRLAALNANLEAVEKQVEETKATLDTTKQDLAKKRAEVKEVERKSVQMLARLQVWKDRAVRTLEKVYTKPVIFQTVWLPWFMSSER